MGFQDIHLIVLTHKHLDHLGATAHFSSSALIAAHRLAAHKISIGEEFVLSNKYFDQPARAFSPDLWKVETYMRMVRDSFQKRTERLLGKTPRGNINRRGEPWVLLMP